MITKANRAHINAVNNNLIQGVDMESKLFTLKAVAERVGVTPRTLYSIIKAGKLKTVRPWGKAPRVTETELERFLSGAPQ